METGVADNCKSLKINDLEICFVLLLEPKKPERNLLQYNSNDYY
jgi:hypothetical protein